MNFTGKALSILLAAVAIGTVPVHSQTHHALRSEKAAAQPATRYDLAAEAAQVVEASDASSSAAVRISERLRKAILSMRDLRRRLDFIEAQQRALRVDVDRLQSNSRD